MAYPSNGRRQLSRFLCRRTELDHSATLLRRNPLRTLREVGRDVKLNYFCHGSILKSLPYRLDSLIDAQDAAGCHLIVKQTFAIAQHTTVSDVLRSLQIDGHCSFVQQSLCQMGAMPFHPPHTGLASNRSKSYDFRNAEGVCLKRSLVVN